MIVGTSWKTEVCQIRGQVSQDLRYQTRHLRNDICDPGRDRQKFKRHHVQITYGLTLGRELGKPLKEEKNNNGQSRNPNSNMPEI